MSQFRVFYGPDSHGIILHGRYEVNADGQTARIKARRLYTPCSGWGEWRKVSPLRKKPLNRFGSLPLTINLDGGRPILPIGRLDESGVCV